MATNQLLKPNDVAIALNVSRSFAYFLIRTGRFPLFELANLQFGFVRRISKAISRKIFLETRTLS